MKSIYQILCIFLISNFSFSQTNDITPDYINELIDNYEAGMNSHADNIDFYNNIDSLSILIDYRKGLFHSTLGYALVEQKYNTAVVTKKVHVMDSLYKLEPNGYGDTLTVLYFLTKGRNYGAQNDPLNELENYIIADSLSRVNENEFLMCTTNYFFAEYYQLNNQIEKALGYDRAVSNYYRDMEESNFQKKIYLQSLLNIGVLHYKLEAYDSAIFYANQSINGGFDDYDSSYDTYILLSKSYYSKGEFTEALTNANRANKELIGKPFYSRGKFGTQLVLGQVKTEFGELDDAYKHLDTALQIADSMNYITSNAAVQKGFLYWGIKKYKCPELKTYFENYIEIKEQLFDQTIEKKEKQLLIQFETSKKERKIIELNEINQKQKTKNLYIVFSLIILLLIATMLVYRNVVRRKILRVRLANSELEKQMTRSKLKQSITNLQDKIKTINELKVKLSSNETSGLSFERITSILGENYIDETQWNDVIYHYNKLHNGFSQQIVQKHNDISKAEIKLLILVKMGFLNKEIADIKGITLDGVKKAKQRLRKKLRIMDFSELEVNQ